MGQRRTRKPHATQEDMGLAEEIMPGPSSGSQNPVVPTTDSEELENTQAQGVSQALLALQISPSIGTIKCIKVIVALLK